MKRLNGDDPALFDQLGPALAAAARDPEVERSVAAIVEQVRAEGDAGLLALTERFDGATLSPADLRVPVEDLAAARASLPPEERDAIEEARANVLAFHQQGRPQDWTSENPHGGLVGERHYPIRRVGVYVPGGQVPLVSTVIMTTTLAKAAGVPQIAVATPPRPDGSIAPALLAALSHCGVDETYKAGGAQAIAALAHGTETIPAVDKIFGPGNAYVNEAKRQVFGIVGIDLLPGPSEVLVLADETARPPYVAAALLAQAEHGSGKENVFLVSTCSSVLERSLEAIEEQIESLTHREAIRRSLSNGLHVIETSSLERAAEIADFIAPEHMELQVDEAKLDDLCATITTAGAILLGHDSPTVLGDFAAGPSHVLPTGRAARFSAGLRLSDFLRRSGVIRYDLPALQKAQPVISRFSSMEQLDAHGASLEVRLTHRPD